MASEQEGATKKPFFGPLMTPAIFSTKWLSKFRDIIYIVEDNLCSTTDTPHRAVEIVGEAWRGAMIGLRCCGASSGIVAASAECSSYRGRTGTDAVVPYA
ncbi:hypothetical protein PRZ48_013548 [Zasmidium cellare]|uniref:Uncharacterized protein n=1 Tax=Zasmidium cellare TaxID=395010 RepID=A0ABR0E1C1_ZASCE|nr:hypothetical protein PRZ48_013548 [Zasmidium cellare]